MLTIQTSEGWQDVNQGLVITTTWDTRHQLINGGKKASRDNEFQQKSEGKVSHLMYNNY